MIWNRIDQVHQIGAIVAASNDRPQLIFKHSTRCSISAAAKFRLESEGSSLKLKYDLHYLDLLEHRNISNIIAERFDVLHQSPQVMVVHKAKAIHVSTHYDIDAKELLELLIMMPQQGSATEAS